MNIGIVGLGLIGGSLAKAYKKTENITVLGCDRNKSIQGFAKIAGAVDEDLDPEHFSKCQCIFLAIRPLAAIEWLKENGPKLPKGALVVDCCGTKRLVCKEGFAIAKENGFTFMGGHPMAGKQYDGFKYSRETLFKDATMILVPEDHNNIDLIGKVKEILKPVGFSRVTVTSPETHDKMIAFTSQMAHVVSNAYIKSPTATMHRGFSAGSYNDMTRVAYLNEDMWTELFMENSDNLLEELSILSKELEQYKQALRDKDEIKLKELLNKGKQCKLEVDGKCR
ncbi:MAG: prephenate dehydrogenase [Anaerovoracaceae bacterium]